MWRKVVALGFAAFAASALCQDAATFKSMDAPALPYYDWNVCPFEGCTYREWTARGPIIVYDTWEAKRRAIARLSKGQKAVGVTGVVITSRPGVIRMNADMPELGLRRGDNILTYTYQGEGVWSAWFKGRFYPELEITFGTPTDVGKHSWWVQVRLSDGRTGWVDMDKARFDGVDQLAFEGRGARIRGLAS